jgi:poly(A) polymerase
MGEAAARALIYRIGRGYFTEQVLLAWSRSDANAADKAWHELATLPQRWTAPEFPLRAADFMARGVEKGPALGAALARAEEAWIAAGFPLDKVALAAIVDDALRD